jgi:ribosomal protein L11 methyltransferase
MARFAGPSRRVPARFYRASLRLPADREEAAVAAFWEAGCLGVEVLSTSRQRGAPRLTLRAYFPGKSARRTLERRLRGALAAAGLADRRPPALRAIAPSPWVAKWQKSLRPMAIGRTFLVVPEGCRVPRRPRRRVVRVRFGQAFGTGEHASTRLCLRLLERHLSSGDRVVDLGTGTAILSMAACRLGAARVLAADDDPVALRVARANLADNHLTGPVSLLQADAADALAAGPCDLALMNIGAMIIARILPDLARALAPGGRAILAGILIEDEPAILDRARMQGLEPLARLRSRPWSALVLRRRGD